jgi:hypothetical protein
MIEEFWAYEFGRILEEFDIGISIYENLRRVLEDVGHLLVVVLLRRLNGFLLDLVVHGFQLNKFRLSIVD